MSNRDKNMFRKEQRFSFRKFSFGLASALIASVIFGGSVASGNVAHANSTTEVAASSSEETATASSGEGQATETATTTAAADTPVERTIVLTYIVNLVDQDGTVVKSEEKTVEVTTTAAVAEAKVVLDETLLPEGYKHVAGLEEVTVTEGAQNVFTVSVEKEAAETPAETPAETTSTTEVQPEVATIVETPTADVTNSATVSFFAYEVNYTTAEGEVVGKTANIVAADSPNTTSQEITVSASDIPAGYELAAGQLDKITAQLTANQVNILSFAVVKKSEEEEIAASQLANKTVLEQVLSEGHLLAKDATRLLETSQAGNAELEAATKNMNKVLAGANLVFDEPTSNQEQVDEQVELVKAASKALADELLKFDTDGILTSQLSWTQTDETSYQVANNDTNLAKVPQNVRITERTVTGQHVHLVVEYNWSQTEGTRNRPYLDFALPKDVVDSSVRVALQHRADSTGSWINQWQEMQGYDITDYRTGQRDLAKLATTSNARLLYDYSVTDATAGQFGLRAKFNDSYYTGTTPKNDAFAGKMRYYFENQMGNTSEIFRYVIDYDIKDGVNPNDTAFFAELEDSQGSAYSIYESKLVDAPPAPVVEKTDQYNITWDNQSVAGRTDAGFEWAQDANGNKVLVYKYDLDDRTAFTTNDVLVQLNASATGLRTLDGTEKALIENADANDGYTTEGNTAKLNGQTIDFLDVVNPNPLWGGRKVVDSTADTSVNLDNYHTTGNPAPDYSTFYVPDTTDPGTVTHSVQIGGTNGVGNITLTDNARDLYTNQVDRQKLYIRSVAASYQDGTGSAIDNDTDTDTIPVYFVGYRSVTNQAPTVTVNSTEGTQLNSDSTNNQYLFVFGTTEGTTETEAGTPNAAPVVNKANATKTFATMSDPEGTNLTISYDNNAAEPKTETSLGSNLTLGTDGKIEGSFAHTAGGYYTRRVKVTDAANATTISSAFYTYAYTDKEVDTTAVTKNEGVAVTDAEIFSKLGIAVTSTGSPNDGKTLPTIPESEYTRTIVGYKQNGTYTEATRDQLPTTGEYEVKVRTRNVYGQDIYNWVTVKYNEAPDITEVGTDTNTTVYQNGTVDHYIFVFGKTEGTTEATNAAGQTAAGNAPVIDKANATKTVVSVSDPENNNPVTITYDNNAEQPKVETTLGSELTVGTDGKLEGYFDHEAGGFHSRRIVATDSLGAKSTSNPFMTYAYTDKEVDTTPVTKTAIGQAVTNEEIFAKLGIVTSSTRFPNNTAAHDVIPTVPTNEYTREVVGYRAVGGTDVTNATTATLPTSGTYEVKVRTRNIYGQDIYNWVTVEYPANTPTTATDKQTIYVFNNTPIQTVDPTTKEPNGVDKVKVATLEDPQGIQSVA
ncbi:TPA: YSIRK-type signal peptide-containing protein, partial [Streptococcus suis]|nr:YSIRK-type signal peptide-containing protein [Streptococcus suis]